MAHYFTQDLLIHLIIFQSALILIIISNLIVTRRTRRHSPPADLPKVSLLVPARNEEKHISICLESLLIQDYPSFEVVVLNDQSSDQTGVILADLVRTHPELRVLDGTALPPDKVGKNWACSQLAEAARGKLLFFTDADTYHHPRTLMDSVTALLGEGADLLTGFPRQILKTPGERLLVPFFSWAALAFIPLGLAYRIRMPAFSIAVGQMMLFRRETYEYIGGHSGVSSSIVDDLDLARIVKREGFRWRVVSIADRISCRMYQDGEDALAGFVKNMFAAFDFRMLPFAFVMTWLGIMFWEPLLILFLKLIGYVPEASPIQLAACLILAILVWALPYLHLGIPVRYSIYYPAVILSNIYAGILSIRHSLSGNLEWKGRLLTLKRWKWI
jgi:chlorobactene glucosyltransferase